MPVSGGDEDRSVFVGGDDRAVERGRVVIAVVGPRAEVTHVDASPVVGNLSIAAGVTRIREVRQPTGRLPCVAVLAPQL